MNNLMKKICAFLLLLLIQVQGAISAEPTLDEQWRDQVSALGPLAKTLESQLSDGAGPRMHAEFMDFIYSNLSMAYFGSSYADPEHPDFWPALNQAYRAGWPNPDDVLYFVPIDDDGVYRIAGHRGSVRILDFQINGGLAGKNGTGRWGPALANYSADSLDIPDSGRFELTLSAARPGDHEGDWLELPAGAAFIMVRQRSYDWLNEVDGRFGIERLDRPVSREISDGDALLQRLRQIPIWAETWTRLALENSKRARQGEPNTFGLIDFSTEGGFTNRVQSYPQAPYTLAADEALLVETEIPEECRYWNFQLVDLLWRTMGGIDRFSSINAHQAVIDADGVFRFVVSAADPGVPNWLDNAGYEKGFVYGRWNLCSSAPTPRTSVVKLADVRGHMPEDTPLVTPAEREKALRERRLGAQMRRRW